mgnify:FL=1
MTRRELKALHKEMLEHGVQYRLAYRWRDGYVQRVYQPADEARELVAWVRENSLFCRMMYARDLSNGRFCRV